MAARLSEEQIGEALSRALSEKDLIGPTDTALVFYDLSFLQERIEDLKRAFPDDTLHAIAIKANPLTGTLRKLQEMGVGAEAATLPEIHLALNAGFAAEKIVFDSPAKTIEELQFALKQGCHVNADSLLELERISSIMETWEADISPNIGVRVNPQVGDGTISSTSVAGQFSKFGVPITENREALIEAFLGFDWLTAIHFHIGSQGCSLEMLLDGARTLDTFVAQINETIEGRRYGTKIKYVDLGGGLPVVYKADDISITMSEYVGELRANCPTIFAGDIRLLTEFGRYVHANSGWTASRIEYIKEEPASNTIMVHVGADMFLRKCYRPDDWHHDILVFDNLGRAKSNKTTKRYTVAGPLCFSGDILARDILLPQVEPTDLLVIRDTGAYTLSMWSRHTSRQMPKVLGYLPGSNRFETLKSRESIQDVLDFWS